MPYATLDDLLKFQSRGVLAHLTDDTGSGEPSVDEGVVSAALEAADGEIDAHLKAVTATPLSSPPQVVKTAAVHLTLGFLYARRGRGDEESSRTLKHYRDRAYEMLKSLRDGMTPLTGAATAKPDVAEVATSQNKFTDDYLGGY